MTTTIPTRPTISATGLRKPFGDKVVYSLLAVTDSATMLRRQLRHMLRYRSMTLLLDGTPVVSWSDPPTTVLAARSLLQVVSIIRPLRRESNANVPPCHLPYCRISDTSFHYHPQAA